MQIDLFTLIAQIVNFLILAGVLWYFLFGRITKAMNEREERISSRIEDAEKKKKEADQEKEDYIQKQTELENQREEIMSQARSQAEDKRREMVQEARNEVEEKRSEWKQALEEQKKSFLAEVRQRTGKQVYAVTRRALRDLASEDIDRHIAEIFIKRISELDENEREKIAELARESRDEFTVISAFDLADDMRDRLRDLVKNQLGVDASIDFEKSPELISGIELRTSGKKVSWSLDNYLDSMEAHLSEVFEREAKGAGGNNAKGERKATANTG